MILRFLIILTSVLLLSTPSGVHADEIYLPLVSNSHPRELATTKIAFSHDGDIHVMNADGTDLTRLTHSEGKDYEPQWSPDGRQILFLRKEQGTQREDIYTIGVEGGNDLLLAPNGWRPTWAPTGDRIAFVKFVRSENSNSEIFVMNADGSNQTNLTANLAADLYPTWAPDGDRIAFNSYRDGPRPEIYVMNDDGSDQTQLTKNAFGDFVPKWSPDGSKILYYATPFGSQGRNIYVMNPDGTQQADLTGSELDQDFAAWSPDGSKVAFGIIENRYLPGTTRRVSNIYLVNRDGTGLRQLTFSDGDCCPSWSPDSKWIAFTRAAKGEPNKVDGIFVIQSDGSQEIQLTHNFGVGSNWSPE